MNAELVAAAAVCDGEPPPTTVQAVGPLRPTQALFSPFFISDAPTDPSVFWYSTSEVPSPLKSPMPTTRKRLGR